MTYITEKVSREIVENKIKDVICNKCGKSTMMDDYTFKGTTLRASFGYGSNKDGEDHSFDLCDACYDNFIDTFKHEVNKETVW